MTGIKTLTEQTADIVKNAGLKHIAIIMDGNRRWAKSKFLPTPVGHQKGVEALKTTLKACNEFGVQYLTVYAFSTENRNRPKEEVDFLFRLLEKTISNELYELDENYVRIKFIGDLTGFDEKLKSVLMNAEETTKNNTGVKLQIAFNYGARNEIVRAVKSIANDVREGVLDKEDITEQLVSDRLYTAKIPEPDLLIRTGGEMRISNYLLWQLAYSEIYVTDTFWPDFDKNSFAKAIEEFQKRTRRFGK